MGSAQTVRHRHSEAQQRQHGLLGRILMLCLVFAMGSTSTPKAGSSGTHHEQSREARSDGHGYFDDVARTGAEWVGEGVSKKQQRPIDPQTSLEAIYEAGPKLAEAKATRVYLEEYRKSLKALLMSASKQTSAAMQERDAYADPSYTAHLSALRVAVEKEESLRWRMVVSQAAIEVWRSQEASNRAIDKGAA